MYHKNVPNQQLLKCFIVNQQESPCVNTCDEMGAAEREESERQARLAEEGLKVKADLIERGKELK